ncbi:MAG: response regulator transcription factor, partial [Sulfurimonas sp.]|nr:response regulator transcription factor [Sulfurimonas sp.]
LKINKNQKIIIVSAYSEADYFIELIRMGVSSFIQKPISSAQIFDTLYEVCTSIHAEREENRYIDIDEYFQWDNKFKILLHNNVEVSLTLNEVNLMNLIINNSNKKFTDLEIFNHIYFDDPEKEVSTDIIKSLLKRLRKKIPKDLIKNNPKLGYNLNKY